MKKEMLEKMLDDTIFCNKELAKYNMELEQENKELKEQLAIREKALELATNYCQREIDGDGIGMQDIPVIYEIGTEFFINKAKESIKNDGK